MDALNEYITKIQQHITSLVELEKEYQGKNKGKIYLEKRVYHKKSLEHWKTKLNRIGKESSVLVIEFDLPQEHHAIYINIFKRYQTHLIGVNEGMAKQIVEIDYPGACHFTFKNISPGILKEIKEGKDPTILPHNNKS